MHTYHSMLTLYAHSLYTLSMPTPTCKPPMYTPMYTPMHTPLYTALYTFPIHSPMPTSFTFITKIKRVSLSVLLLIKDLLP